MSNFITAKLTIRGTRPILFHHFGPDALPSDKSTRTERTGAAGNDPEEWRKTVLMTAERQLYIEPTYIFGCLRDAAKYTKQGRGSLQAPLAATLQVMDDRILLDRFVPAEPIPTDPELPVYMDIRGVKNPATRGRNVRYRVAASTGWEASIRLLWDKTIINRSQMEAIIIDGGRLVGLGDGRSIGYGRFDVVSFEVQD